MMSWEIWIMAAIVGIPSAIWIAERLIFRDEGERLTHRFIVDAERRGVPLGQAFKELDLRTRLARVRRLASEDVMAYPDEPWLHVRRRLATETETLMREDQDLGRLWISWTGSLGLADLLEPHALKESDRRAAELRKGMAKPKLSPDEIAALRIR